MGGTHWSNSLATRLVAGQCLGGIVLAVVTTAVMYRLASHEHSAAAGQNLTLTAYHLRDAVKPLLEAGDDQAILNILNVFARDPRIEGVRLVDDAGRTFRSEHWPTRMRAARTWTLGAQATTYAEPLPLDRRTIIAVPLHRGGPRADLRLVVDGPYMRSQIRRAAIGNVAATAALLGLLTLLALVLMRRWFTGPLVRLAEMASTDAPAQRFEAEADRCSGELRSLATAVGRMLRRIDEMTGQVRHRERAYAHLYEFAPAAMLSIAADGRIADANQRAADMLGEPHGAALIDQPILEYIHPGDRATFRGAVERLSGGQVSHCELRVTAGEAVRETAVQLAGVHRGDGRTAPSQVRLSLLDISESRRLLDQMNAQRRLLDLVIHHMSDGILIVSTDGRIVSANARLCQMLKLHREALIDEPFEPADLFAPLEPVNDEAFERRLRAAETADRAVREQFECRSGSFTFGVIPVQESSGQSIAQLWVVQETTAESRSRRLLQHQDAQLRALQRMSAVLNQADGVDDLLRSACGELSDVAGVEAVGLALRQRDPNDRCRQIVHDRSGQMPLAAGRDLVDAVQTRLMPEVLRHEGTNFWPDLVAAGDWAGVFDTAGFESIAATALRTRDGAQGIVWIARKGGKPIDRYHIYLLEALAPMISSAVQNAGLRDRMQTLELTDPVTGLPSVGQLPLLAGQTAGRGPDWSLLLVDIDHFGRLNERLGLADANAALREVAEALRGCCRLTDQPLRYSEDKFAVLCPATPSGAAGQLAERIRGRVAAMTPAPTRRGDAPPALTCSIGVAAAPADGRDVGVLIDVALGRVRHAKASGRNRVVARGVDRAAQAG